MPHKHVPLVNLIEFLIIYKSTVNVHVNCHCDQIMRLDLPYSFNSIHNCKCPTTIAFGGDNVYSPNVIVVGRLQQ